MKCVNGSRARVHRFLIPVNLKDKRGKAAAVTHENPFLKSGCEHGTEDLSRIFFRQYTIDQIFNVRMSRRRFDFKSAFLTFDQSIRRTTESAIIGCDKSNLLDALFVFEFVPRAILFLDDHSLLEHEAAGAQVNQWTPLKRFSHLLVKIRLRHPGLPKLKFWRDKVVQSARRWNTEMEFHPFECALFAIVNFHGAPSGILLMTIDTPDAGLSARMQKSDGSSRSCPISAATIPSACFVPLITIWPSTLCFT